MEGVFERVTKSASVLLIKPHKFKQPESEYDYNVFLFQRNPDTKFGGLYAYPGGKIDNEDYYENWQTEFPEFSKRFSNYEDFALRIACLRELYEE